MMQRLIGLSALAFACLQAHCQQTDRFAQIGNREAATRLHLLATPRPLKVGYRPLAGTHRPAAAFVPMNKLDTRAELDSAMAAMRVQYAPFQLDLAPRQPATRRNEPLQRFQWRVETDTDRIHFSRVLAGEGSWTPVNVPHYGPPLGKAVTYYRTPLNLPVFDGNGEALYLRFNGVDYKATVFVNGYRCAENEGGFIPFSVNITPYLKKGDNVLVVRVENDYPMMGHVGDDGRKLDGDKIYAATGMGYDDPQLGWHHNPPGMGINQQVWLEVRPKVHFSDVFVRPLRGSDSAEVWVEVSNTVVGNRYISVRHSVYGQNFADTVYAGALYQPQTVHVPGVGDLAKSTDWEEKKLPMGPGINFLKWTVHLPGARRWNPETPWLYQLQLELVNDSGRVVDRTQKQFGMRTFTQDTAHAPKGMFYLNGQPIRLRGANNMGNLMLAVMRGDRGRLRDDILLAKLTHMNYLRMTQMPVQSEVYEICDRLGMLTQTDLPLFGVLRRTKVMEAVRQAHEMERLVRGHPSNILVSYINERFPNAEGNPQRHLDSYADYALFFQAADAAVLSANPDRVIKAGDGDYDPPSPGLPDNHVYNFWYNGHGLGIGQMIKGYWVPVKPGWYYGCGEFGSEGLDPLSTMRKYYPEAWLPQTDTSAWRPDVIAMSQTWKFHYMWFNKQRTLPEWIAASQKHQEQATRLMTEALRRNNRVVSSAIHLFIDAWPAGWMKAIMDVDRNPKPAWYAYRDALTPLAVNWRSDRFQYFSGERLASELWLCNDRNDFPSGTTLRYQVAIDGKLVWASQTNPISVRNGSRYQGTLNWQTPLVSRRSIMTVSAVLADARGRLLHEASHQYTLHPEVSIQGSVFVPPADTVAQQLVKDLRQTPVAVATHAGSIVISNVAIYTASKSFYDRLVKEGRTLVLLNLPAGEHFIGVDSLKVEKPTMGAYYFVSNATRHPLAQTLNEDDLRYWYDAGSGMIQPMLQQMVYAPGWNPVLTTGNTGWTAANSEALALAERQMGLGKIVVCQVLLQGRVRHNPAAGHIGAYLLRSGSGAGSVKR